MKINQAVEDAVKQWDRKSKEINRLMGEWRKQHPKATLREIEKAVDEHINQLRAKMIEGAALVSEVREWEKTEAGPVCPDCKVLLRGAGRGERSLQTNGGETVELEREYGLCPQCGQGFFPPG